MADGGTIGGGVGGASGALMGSFGGPEMMALGGIGGGYLGNAIGDSDLWSYLSGGAQAKAARHAAELQAQSAEQANQMLGQQFGYGQQLLGPIAGQAQGMYGQLGGMLNQGQFNMPQFQFDPNQISQNPGYQFLLKQGQKAMNQNAAASGGVLGGAQQKALQGFGQGLGNQYLNTFFNQALGTQQQNQGQLQQQYQRYADLIGQGLPANESLAKLAAGYGGAYGENLMQAANARAAGKIGAANAYSGALSKWLPSAGDVLGALGGMFSSGGGKGAAATALV